MSAKNTQLSAQLVDALKGKLVVSCQPVDKGPMDKVEHIVAMAQAAVAGGAAGVRIEGAGNVAAVATAVTVPIIGIVKRDLFDSPVRITPFLDDVRDLAAAGAQIIAVDATRRVRPETVETLVNEIHRLGCIAMADCDDFQSALSATSYGVTFIGTTLSGYTGEGDTPELPDLELVTALAECGMNVIAEGRYNTPSLAADAVKAGAMCVTVGSAVTRIEHITQWFNNAIDESIRSGAVK